MSAALSPSAARVQAALLAAGSDAQVREFAAPARTVADAAALMGCEPAQIAKSIIFKSQVTGQGVLVIASGQHRVDEAKVAAQLGESLGKADAAFVREVTGYAIGGVPPLGHASALRVIFDAHLLSLGTVYAAGGTPNALFAIDAAGLVKAAGGRVADVALSE